MILTLKEFNKLQSCIKYIELLVVKERSFEYKIVLEFKNVLYMTISSFSYQINSECWNDYVFNNDDAEIEFKLCEEIIITTIDYKYI